MKVYLDYAATSPVKAEVYEAINPYLREKFGNPSSIHSFGQEARKAVDEAREKVARFLNCKPGEVIFTSGGTESINLVILGLIDRCWVSFAQDIDLDENIHDISLATASRFAAGLPSRLA